MQITGSCQYVQNVPCPIILIHAICIFCIIKWYILCIWLINKQTPKFDEDWWKCTSLWRSFAFSEAFSSYLQGSYMIVRSFLLPCKISILLSLFCLFACKFVCYSLFACKFVCYGITLKQLYGWLWNFEGASEQLHGRTDSNLDMIRSISLILEQLFTHITTETNGTSYLMPCEKLFVDSITHKILQGYSWNC